MIPEKIKALFDFIDYLDENKSEYIEKYLPLCAELEILDAERSSLKPSKNYIDKQQYDKVQSQIKEKFAPILSYIFDPLTGKLKELNIWTGDSTFSSIWNNNISAISDFKKDFLPEDVPTIFQYKQKYLSFRTDTNSNFLCLSLVFNELDEIMKELFDFFKDSPTNEFDSFETKIIEANNIEDAIKKMANNKEKNLSFSIPAKTFFEKPSEKQEPAPIQKIKNKIIMGDKIKVGDISNNKGPVSVGKDNLTKVNDKDDFSVKSFNWQKWGIIIGTILSVAAIIVAIVFA